MILCKTDKLFARPRIVEKSDQTMPAPISVPLVAVVGSRRSGKTTTVEAIVRGLTKKKYKVASVKHIHEPNFTIDSRGKDTWRQAKAGARIVVGVAARELAVIKKVDTTRYTLSDITQSCTDNVDIIILEGFRDLVAQDQTLPKVVTAKSKDEVAEATKFFKPILAFTGLIPKSEAQNPKAPYIDVKKEPEKLVGIIEKRVAPIIRKRQESKESVGINVNGKALPLNPYVQKVTRNVLFAIVSTLKGGTVRGDENLLITISSHSENKQ